MLLGASLNGISGVQLPCRLHARTDGPLFYRPDYQGSVPEIDFLDHDLVVSHFEVSMQQSYAQTLEAAMLFQDTSYLLETWSI
ncbi:MAG: hypothetical protein ACXWCY_31260 [Burkholderiales bacterium]